MTTSERSTIRQGLALLVLLAVLGFAFQGTRGLWETDEGRYTNIALQMTASGNYMVPSINADTPHFSKPPMTYWVIAASMRLFGHNTWAVRAPYALAFIAIGLFLFGMGRRLLPDIPWLPPLIYASSLAPFLAANAVSTDMILTAFEAWATYAYIAGRTGAVPGKRKVFQLQMWLAFALAFETKGPPGLLPLLAIVVFEFRARPRSQWRWLFRPAGLIAFIVVAFAWYAVVVTTHPGLLDYFLQKEVVDRVATGMHDRHPGWFGWLVVYGPMLLLGALPWWGIAAWHAVACRRRTGSWPRADHANVLLRRFVPLWFALPMAVFVLAQSRLPLYILPLFMPLSLGFSALLVSWAKRWQRGSWLAIAVWIVVLLAIKGGVAEFVHPGNSTDDRRMSTTLLERVPANRFAALVFVNDRMYQGMRLYTGKPAYHLSLPERSTDVAGTCRKWMFPRPAVLSVPADDVAALRNIFHTCAAGTLRPMGTWAGKRLFLTTRSSRDNGA